MEVASLFEGIEAKKSELGIQDWGLSQTSLEEVFLQTYVANGLGAASAPTPSLQRRKAAVGSRRSPRKPTRNAATSHSPAATVSWHAP